MDKITIERETLEMALAALGEYEHHYGWRIGPTVELRAALAAQPAEQQAQTVCKRTLVEIDARLRECSIVGASAADAYDTFYQHMVETALAAQPAEPVQRLSDALLDLDSVEHMQGGANGPTIRLRGLINAHTGPTAPQPPIDNAFVAEGCEQFSQPVDIVNPISQQEPVAYRHSKTGQLYDSEEEVPLADGDEWAEPLYATPATQQAPAAWRQWSTKLHDWDYQTNRGDLRPDTPADPLFVAAAQLVPLTDEQRNDRIEAWSSQGWGDRLGEVVRICIAIERAHGIAAAGDKP